MPLTIREWTGKTRLRRHLVLMAAAILVFSYLGPFGTGVLLGPAERAVYWGAAISVNWAIAAAIMPSLARRALSTGNPLLPALALGALAGAAPGTLVVWGLEHWVGRPPDTAATLLYVYSCVALVYLVLSYIAVRLVEAPEQDREPSVPDGGGAPPAFLSRLPAHLGTDILHLRMQDHYVEAHTARGRELVLLRFRDALRELEGLDGLQVHRSHWVARKAVAGTARRGGRTFLRLTNGAEVPVSRSHVATLRSAGWL